MVSLLDQVDQETVANFCSYERDPIGFQTEILDVKPEWVWPKMREVAESVRDNQLTVVPACHSSSKTFEAARIGLWFKSIFQPSTVLTTAPSDTLVRNQLWREIHAGYAGAKVPLGGNMTELKWDVKPQRGIFELLPPEEKALWEINFMLGLSTSPDQAAEHATKIQGFHNRYFFAILDEGCGILRLIWRAIMDGLIINENCKVLAIGNPTDPTSEFYNACQPSSGWNVIPISVFDTPNYQQGGEVIPGLAGRDYERRMRERHGVDSNSYKIHVRGEFGDYKEGTFYGRELAVAERDGHIGDYPVHPGYKVYAFLDIGDMYTAVLFVQLIEGTVRIVDCYWDNAGAGIPEYARAIDAKPYNWDKTRQYAGPDLIGSNEKSAQTGKTMRDVAAGLGINLIPVIKHSFDDGIQAVRLLWPLLRINRSFCKVFLDAVRAYHKRKNERLSTEDQPSYHDDPVPNNWANHVMDALRHLGIAYWHMSIGGETHYLGARVSVPANQSGSYDNRTLLRGMKLGRKIR